MNITDIEVFLAIVSQRSITKAAEVMHFSQSTISNRLKLLEEELGTQLIDREKGQRCINLTAQGEQFVTLAERWINLHREIYAFKSNPSHSITISMVDSMSATILPEVFSQVVKDDTSIRLQISTHQSSEIFDLIENRTADIGFVSILFQRQNISSIPFISQKYYVVHLSDNPVSPRKVHPQSLDPNFEIFQSWGIEYDKWHEYWWGHSMPHIRVDTVALLPYFLANERYWTIINDSSLKQLCRRMKNIQVDELTDPPPDRVCYMIKHKYPKAGRIKGVEILEKHLEAYLCEKKMGSL
ncbi:MAG: LysR family transcriptional regulator [Clostridiaceae bacterium]|jgi:DNA-binding transcriptional LysR family regulator|nr:LysR family transcriptional regulator [Clostridiaceae bacterium]